MTTTTAPNAQAWLAKEATSLGPFVVRLDGDRIGTAVAPGHWVVAVDASGGLQRVGRILRIRTDLEATTLYFDKLHVVKKAGSLTNLGLTLPQGLVTRLRPEDLSAVLARDGMSSPDDIPLIQDAAYVRELLELATRDDLLGPANGPEELVIDMSVRDRYLVGKLAPRAPGDVTTANEVEPSAAADEEDDSEHEEKAPLHEPGAEFNRASGRVEPEDDALDEIDTTNNQSLVPSSLGLTFCVGPDVKTLDVTARWGSYARVPKEEHEYTRPRKNRETGEVQDTKVKVWRRTPRGGLVTLTLEDGVIKPIAPDADQDEVRIQGAVRTNAKGERLVTLFLVNDQREPETNRDSAWLFQPELSVKGSGEANGTPVFLRRPSNDVVVDDAERDHLGLIYRRRVEFAVGHGVAVHAETPDDDLTRAIEVRTEVIPSFEVPVTETPGLDPEDRPAMKKMVERGWLDMLSLADLDKAELEEALKTLVDDYAAWIGDQRARVGKEIKGYDAPANEALDRCATTLERLRAGLKVLLADPKALEAFRFANRSMARQRVRGIYALKRRRGEELTFDSVDVRKNRSWRPFQLAFLLLSIPSLADPKHPDRTSPAEAFADLLWFPTGGGKTEAYLGVAAFAMGIRRLQGVVENLDGGRGLTVIMRYTLRLLTLQQFQRAATLLCAMEIIRTADVAKWGAEPFTLGLWVGNKVTPGTTETSHQAIEAIRDKDRNRAGIASPAQLTSCPWCGTEIQPGRDIEVDKTAGRTAIYCGDKLSQCEFSKAKSSSNAHPGLPVKLVDEEIYHRPPTMMIATVDKFAMMAWRAEVRTLFGNVREECERHGLLWPGHDCGGGHKAKKPHPAAKVKAVRGVRPPDLIIQDEFHLISGPLGTMVGLYETAVDDLCSWHDREDEGAPEGGRINSDGATRGRSGAQRLHAAPRDLPAQGARRRRRLLLGAALRREQAGAPLHGHLLARQLTARRADPHVHRVPHGGAGALRRLREGRRPVHDDGRLLQLAARARRHEAPRGRRRPDPLVPREDEPRAAARARAAERLDHRRADLAREQRRHSEVPRPARDPVRRGVRHQCGAACEEPPSSRSPSAHRRRARDQHALRRRRREPPRRHGRERPAQGHGRVHPGDEPRRPRVPRSRRSGAHVGAAARPLALRDLRALPRDVLPTRRGAVGHAVLAARDGPWAHWDDARRDAEPLRAVRAEPGCGRADEPEPAGHDGRRSTRSPSARGRSPRTPRRRTSRPPS